MWISDLVTKFCLCVSVSLLFLDHSNGIFELVPTGTLLVCPGPSQLKVNCSSSESSFLEWNLTFPAFGEPLLTDTRIISSTNAVGRVNPIRLPMEDVLFEFFITSRPPNPLGLATQISVNKITPKLNGGKILCRELGTTMDQNSTITLNVVNTSTAYPPSPMVQINSELFGMTNVTVILEWTNVTAGGAILSYNASVIPESPSAQLLEGNIGIRLVLLYNTQYSLNTVATLCEQNSAITVTELSYVNCGEPTTNPSVRLDYNSTLLGSQLLLWCEEIDDVKMALLRCSENGTWVPDPAEFICSPSLDLTEINWMLIGICISVGVLFGVICVVITVVILVIIIRKGSRHQQTDSETITEVEHQEKDINMSVNVVYEQVKSLKEKVVLHENVAYCSTSECVSTDHIYD